MRKLVIITLILSLVLVGCTIRDPDKNTTNTPDLNLSATSKYWSSHTDPSDSMEGITTGPATSDPTMLNPLRQTHLKTAQKGPSRLDPWVRLILLKPNHPSRQLKLQPLPQHLLRKQNRCRPHLLRQRLHGLLSRRQRRWIKPKK